MKLFRQSILPIALLTSLFAVPDVWAVTIFASDARNVSDFEQVFNPDGSVSTILDGDGDQRSLPVYPWLGAGIFSLALPAKTGPPDFRWSLA